MPRDVVPRRRKAHARSNVGAELLLAEYGTVRDESRQAREAQQATLNWSLAGLAGLFGGGLIYATATLKGAHPHAVNAAIFFLIFGVVIPGFAIASAVTYVGEIERMERAGRYLRGFEIALASERVAGRAPLLWEGFLSEGDIVHSRRRKPRMRKSSVSYVGGFMIYCGGMVASYAICSVLWADGSYSDAIQSSRFTTMTGWDLPTIGMSIVAGVS